MKGVFGRFVRDERGVELVEYGVMMALIVAALATALALLSGAIASNFGLVRRTIHVF